MKKKILCVMMALLLCASLCACGDMRQDSATRNDDMDILPDVSPMISPDRQDGEVTDGDGFIGNGENGTSPSPASVSTPMPSPSMNPDSSSSAGQNGAGSNTGSNAGSNGGSNASPKP